MKLIFYGLFINILLITSSPVNAQTPELLDGWPQRFSWDFSTSFATPRFDTGADVETDSLMVFYNTNNGLVIKYDIDGEYCNGWPIAREYMRFEQSPLIVDLDHDSRAELITAGILLDEFEQHLHRFVFSR
jgi:hypothetical protein